MNKIVLGTFAYQHGDWYRMGSEGWDRCNRPTLLPDVEQTELRRVDMCWTTGVNDERRWFTIMPGFDSNWITNSELKMTGTLDECVEFCEAARYLL